MAALLAPAPLLLAGCAGSGPTSPQTAAAQKPFAGVTLTAACPDPALAELVEQRGRDWGARTGAKVVVVREAFDANKADVGLLPPAEMPAFAARGELEPVPNPLLLRASDYQWETLLPAYGGKLLRWGKPAYALPVLGGGRVLVYRTDLLDDPEHGKKFEERFKYDLAPPQTWEAAADVAEYFRDVLGGPSLPPLPSRPEDLDFEFYAVAAPFARPAVAESELSGPKAAPLEGARADRLFSFQYHLSTGKPLVATRPFRHALDWCVRVQKCRAGGESVGPWEAFRSGKAVLCVAPLGAVAAFQKEGSPVRNRFGILPVPGSTRTFDFETGAETPNNPPESVNRVPYVGSGGWLGVVRKGSPNAAAGFDFLKDFGSLTTGQELIASARWGAGPFRGSHLDDPVVWLGYGLDPKRTAELREALKQQYPPSLANPALRLRTPDQGLHMRALTEELRRVLTGKGDPAKALGEVERRWNEIDAKIDPETRKANYRRSVGLEG